MNTEVTLICKECGKGFNRRLAEHKMNARKGRDTFCSLTCWGRSHYFHKTIGCPKCGDEFSVKVSKKNPNKHKKFCSRRCANSRDHSEITKSKIGKSVKTVWKETPEVFEGSILAAAKPGSRFTSAGEEEIRTYFMDNRPSDEWTFGGSIDVGDGIRFSRDLYSNKLKAAIEYDGIWHFKDIHGQLKDKQLKDRLYDEWCMKNGWLLIRIRERVYKNEPELWKKRLEEIIYSRDMTDTVIKLYN